MTLTDHERLPYERSPADALEAFRQGQGWEAPLGRYFEDLAEGLTMLAELFNGGDDHNQEADKTMSDEFAEEWEGDLEQLRVAIKSRSKESIGWYLRDAAEILRHSAQALHPGKYSRQWHLRFYREGGGRRSDPWKKQSMETEIRMELVGARQRGIKQESVIAELQKKYGVSRPTIFRLMRGRLSQKKR
jgi:hypothetical protein